MPTRLDPKIFLDSAYLIALGVPVDQHHALALKFFQTMESTQSRIVTHHGVLFEVGSSLSKIKFRKSAIHLLQSIQNSTSVEVVSVTEELAKAGWELFRSRSDKEWSWVDCISFVLMRERGIRQALTTDEHFEQAGFIPLLR